MNKAVFWDRDGVINQVLPKRHDGFENVGPLRFKDFQLTDGISGLLNQTKGLGFLNIMVTNQPDISRQKISWEELNKMHDFIKTHAPSLDAIYVCPHGEEDNCSCRKPKPGMFFQAAKDYHLDLNQSFMVGDTEKDIVAARAAGAKGILYRTHYNKDVKNVDFEVTNLGKILEIIGPNTP